MSPWSPLLAGAEAARADQAVTAIAEALGAAPLPVPAGADRGAAVTLAGGEAGLALFFLYLDQARPGQGWGEIGEQRLERAVDALAETFQTPGLYGGFAGVAWVAAHGLAAAQDLAGLDDLNDIDQDPLAEIDQALLRLLGQTPWPHHFDLVSGLVGLGVYALERLPRPAAVAALELAVERLAELAAPRAEGLAWFTPPALLHRESQVWYPRGYDNLGLAHGTPGVIALLARAAAAGVAAERARELAAGGMAWLLAQRLPDGGASLYPYAVGPEVPVRPARTAWCYGDPGIAAVLLLAGRALGEPGWEEAGLEIARAAARRAPDAAGVVDAGLCHGAAGLGHLFSRLGQAAGDSELLAAARAWLGRALDQRSPGEWLGGFRSWVPAADGEMEWRTDPSFLTGAAGTGLALLAAASPVEPAWDRLLLLSPIPDPGGWAGTGSVRIECPPGLVPGGFGPPAG